MMLAAVFGLCIRGAAPSTISGQALAAESAKIDRPVLVVDAADRGHRINPTQYGVFFEEISHGGEGGLYAELIRNRSFEESLEDIPSWSFYATGSAGGGMSLESEGLLNAVQTRALKIEAKSAGTVGVANSGFWGVNVQQDREYTLTFFAKSALSPGATMTARLQNQDGSKTYASHTFSRLAAPWARYSAKLRADGTATNGRFALEVSTDQPGAVWLDVVSLFPPTWKGRPNGTRPDIAQMIADMNPKIIRMPGGSYTSTWPRRAPKWLEEIGPVEARSPHPAPGEKCEWGYNCSRGFGFHEYLLFAEDLGAEPIYVFQGGADPRANLENPETYLAGAALDRLIGEILDGIEYANGDVTTEWGAKRAANGHPKPFRMKYVQIGNENFQKPFQENYVKIYHAIKGKHPKMQVIWGGDWIGNNQHGYKSDGIMPEGSAAEIVDEHFYKGDDWFYEHTERYSPARYPRGVEREAKIFIGEVSAMSDDLNAALKEAAFLLGAERYSDKVVMAVYAPLLCNVNFKKCNADAIYFDNHRVYGTPSYYAQGMLGNHVGDVNIGVGGLNGLLGKSLFVNANRVESSGEVIVKIVNRDAAPHPIRVEVRNAGSRGFEAQEIVMTAGSQNACNSFDKPRNVAPAEHALGRVACEFGYTVRQNSFTVLRLASVPAEGGGR
jgi:alpha-L-arabinofuranosidase